MNVDQTRFDSRSTLQLLCHDDSGFIVCSELVVIATVALLGLAVALATVRDATISEISDTVGAVQDFNQCYTYNSLTGHSSTTCGSDFVDAMDFCDDADDVAGVAQNCITIDLAPAQEGDEESDDPEITTYTNDDTVTDIAGSQNLTQMKFSVERGNDVDADALADAIVDSIDSGGTARITWTTVEGETYTFDATSYTGGPENYLFDGSATESGSGKMVSATVECIE